MSDVFYQFAPTKATRVYSSHYFRKMILWIMTVIFRACALAFRRSDMGLANRKTFECRAFGRSYFSFLPIASVFHGTGISVAANREERFRERTAGDASPIRGKKWKRHVAGGKKTHGNRKEIEAAASFRKKNLIIVRRERKRWSKVSEREWKYRAEEKAAQSWKEIKKICSEIRWNNLTLMRTDGVAELKRKWKCHP